MPRFTINSPIGRLTLVEEGGALAAITWRPDRSAEQTETPLLAQVARQLSDYFEGARTEFDLPLVQGGNAFQQRVWQAMSDIPYGETRSYGALAKMIGGSARAVGSACGQNPIPIVVPCHRVIGADGRLVGYSGGEGVATKRSLLQLEGALLL